MSLLDIFKSLLDVLCSPLQSKPQQEPVQSKQQQQQTSTLYQPTFPPQKPQRPTSPLPRPHGSEVQNQINQSNEYYASLRARANEEGDLMAKSFEESHKAYASRDGAAAKALSNQGKEHQRRMEDLNKQASDWIFVENNKNRRSGEIDLHGLYVKEAISRTDQAIEEAKRRGDSELHLIVGKGLHSQGGAAKIKPAIEELMLKHQLVAVDLNNSGVLIVQVGKGGNKGMR